MADDQNQKPYDPNEPPARGAPAATPGSSSDPLAELARLIGQTDPFAEFGRDNSRRAAPPPPPAAPPPAPNFGANEYFDAAPPPPPPPARPPASQALPYGAPDRARQPYGGSPYAAGADLYHTETEAPEMPAAQGGHYQQSPPHHAGDDEDGYDDVPPARRRIGIMAIAAVFALAVIGTAGAFGYRALFGSSTPSQPPPVIKADNAPSKIVPASANKTPNKLITDRVADHAQDEKIVSREERPVEMKDKPAGAVFPPNQNNAQAPSAQPAVLGSGVISSEPKKVRTIAIHPDQASMGENQPMTTTAAPPSSPPPAPPPARIAAPAPPKPAAPPARAASNPPAETNTEPPPAPPRQTATRIATPVRRTTTSAGGNAPLSLSPNAQAAPAARAPMRTAAVAAPAQIAPARSSAKTSSSGSYAVQVSSQRSEADAQASFRSLQAKYPNQLGGRQALIRKVDLGAKGTYYRAMVGPFANAGDASALCSGLKAAGAQCLIQRN